MDIKYVILTEPERLFLRYLIKGNSIFLFLEIRQLSKKNLFRKNKKNNKNSFNPGSTLKA